ncbi:MAG: insulinase family protein [Deltaproteobacteria bacterium]|nr:insulinase family protein [Deltaproteobacteria bacterium]
MNKSFFSKFTLILTVTFMVSRLLSANAAYSGVDESYILPNGLKAVFVPQPGNPVISALVMVKVGSASENGVQEYGLAHLMEHMAFKGTKKRGLGVVSGLVENNGGNINAYTSFDSTVYYLSLPAERLELALDVLSDITFSPSYDPAEYLLEKEVVVEEIKKSTDSPDHLLWDTFMFLAFPEGHPYHHRILGSEQTVREVSRDLAFAFHNRYYRPDNAVVIVTGGFDPDEAKTIVAKYFGQFENPKEATPELSPPKDIISKGPVVEIIENPLVTVPKAIIGFRCASGGSPEAPSLHLISEILSQGRSGRLTENVKIKKGLVTDIGTFPYTAVRDGVFVLQLETEAEKILDAFEAIFIELESLAEKPPTSEEMARARVQAAKNFIDRQESSDSLASLLTSFELYSGDYRLKDAYLAQWSRVTSTDLARLANKLFTPENMTITIVLPSSAAKPDKEALGKLASGLALKPVDPALSAAPDFEDYKLKNGARVLLLRDPTLPLVEVRLYFRGGLLAEGKGRDGLSNLMSRVWSKAPESMNSEVFARKVEDLGASIDGSSGRNSVSLSGSFMASNWLEGLDLLTEVLLRPAFADDNLQEARQEILAYLKMQDEHLQQRLFKLLRRALYKDHPYHGDVLGLIETVANFTRDDLIAFYRDQIRPDNLVLAVSGDIEPVAVLEALERRLSGWAPGASGPLDVYAPPSAPPAPIFVHDSVETAQTHIALAFLTPGIGHPDQAALEVLEYHLSGLGGLLFRELRDKRSLAYTVSAGFNPGLEVGAFSFYIASDSQKTSEALSGLLEMIDVVREKPLTNEELEGAIRYVTGTRKIHLQTLVSRSNEAILSRLYDLGLDFNRRYLLAIEEVTSEDIIRVAQKYLRPDHLTLAVVGSAKSIEASQEIVKSLTQ